MQYDTICESHVLNESTGRRELNPAWLRARKKGVSATEAAGLMTGASALDLWGKKTGRVDPDDLSKNERVFWGNQNQNAILSGYAEERYAGRVVVPTYDMIRSQEHPWLLATLDAWTLHEDWGMVPLDAKNTDKFMEYKWEDGIPENYRWQIIQQAVCAGAKGASIACLLGGNRLIWGDEEALRVDIDRLLDVTKRFWWCVENDVTPDQVDGLPETKAALNRFFVPNPANPPVKLPANFNEKDADYANIAAELKELNASVKDAEKRRDAIANEIKLVMRNATEAVTPNGTVYKLKQIVRKPFSVTPKPYNKLTRKAPKKEK